MKFRNRDLAAIVVFLVLFRTAWNDNLDSLSATAHLAFYVPNPHNDDPRSSALAPFDLDGDGTSEAIAMAVAAAGSDGNSWKLQILDLKPLHQAVDIARMAPFQPERLFESPEIVGEHMYPIHVTTGQVLVRKRHGEARVDEAKPDVKKDAQADDRTRHYFCGNSWHEASESCGTPCPSGQSGDCPGDERCFADTPCDALAHERKPHHDEKDGAYHLTPGGGLPSVASFWSDGYLQLHSLAADKASQEKPSKGKNNLELRLMWKTRIFPEKIKMESVDWEEGGDIQFLDATDSIEAKAAHGMILVRGEYFKVQDEHDVREDDMEPEDVEDDIFVSFIIAVDAMTGKVMWESFSNGDEIEGKDEPLPLPIQRGATSSARRRSKIPTIHHAHSVMTHTESGSMRNCLAMYKHSIGDVLPFAHWGPDDSGMAAMHMNHGPRGAKGKHSGHHGKHAKQHDHGHLSKSLGHAAGVMVKKTKKRWHHRFHRKAKTDRVFGRPNVVVTHNHGGLQIRSLKNGHLVCHLSLMDEVLYADLNSDGIVDQVQILMGSSPTHDRFVWKLAQDVKKNNAKNKPKDDPERMMNVTEESPQLCHAMALSGMPAKEELFSSSLCGGSDYPADDTLTATTPIVVESLDGYRGSRDVVVALGNGVVHRLDGATGRHEWKTSPSKNGDDFPTWEGVFSGLLYTLLTRVQSDVAPPALRPILLVGHKSMVLLSAKTGGTLSSAAFPQESNRRPILADVNGDGTTDVLITTQDAVWGFQIVVTSGAPIFLRIMVGLLFMGILLAVVKGNTGPKQDKRSSDE